MFVLLMASLGQAQAQSYTYDGNGRLVGATVPSGESVRYVYDDIGNLQQVVSVPAGTPSIFALTPSHGSIGVPVTIRGQGFGATPASNVVLFNGTAATIGTATTTSLTTTVPSGAVTGPVTVTTNGKTATSDQPFVVDGTGLPPSIASFSPAIVASGTAVTVQGQHLAPVAGQTSLSMNDQAIKPTSVTDAVAMFNAPVSMGSGRITVQTPFGVATSTADLVIVPSNIGLANIGPVARMTPTSSPTLAIPSSKYGVVLFDAGDTASTQWITLHLHAMTGATTASFYVYDPRNRVVYSGNVSPTAPSLHLPKLTMRGTYSFYLSPSSSQGSSVTVGMDIAPRLVLDATTAVPVTTVAPSESKRYMFTAAPGVLLTLPSISTTPTGGSGVITVSDDAGASVANASGTSSVALNLPQLKSGRLYQAVVSTSSNTTINTSIRLATLPGGTLTIDGPSIGVTANPGVSAAFSFTAAPDDNLEFALDSVTMSTGSFTSADVYIYDSAGTYIAGTINCSPNNPAGTCRVPLSHLAGGTYSVVVKSESAQAVMSFKATLTRDVTGLLKVGTAQAFNFSRPGQSGRLTFQATAGDTLALAFSSLATTPTGRSLTVSVIRPDGTALGSDSTLTTDGAVNLPNLPATGTYTVLIRQDYGLPMSFQLLLAPQAGGALTVDGPSLASSPVVGQNGYFTFTAAPGDNLELALNAVAFRASCSSVTMSVYDAKGNYVAGGNASSSTPGLVSHLWGLAGGNYSVTLSTCMANGTLTLTRDVTATLAVGQSQSFNLSRNGQTLRVAFNGTAGQTLAVGAQAFTTTPAGKPVTTTVLNPDGTRLTGVDSSTPGLLNLRNLATSGTYTFIVSPDASVPATVQASVLDQVGGVLVPDSDTVSVSTAPGQSAYFTFSAATGDNLEFALSGLTMGGVSSGVSYYVYGPNGATVANNALETSGSAGSSRVSLPNLAAGTYAVTVSSYSGSTAFTTSVTLTRDVTGVLAVGGSTAINLPRRGQVARYTFSGTAGQALTLGLPSYAPTPSGQTLAMVVKRPEGTQIGSATMNAGNSYAIPTLPVTGTYTVTLAPAYGVPATMTVSLK